MRMILNIYEYNKYFCVFVSVLFFCSYFALLVVLHLLYLFSAYAFISYPPPLPLPLPKKHDNNGRKIHDRFCSLSFLFVYCWTYKVKIASILEYSGLCVSFDSLVHTDSLLLALHRLPLFSLCVLFWFTGVLFAPNHTRKMEKQISMEIVKMAFQSPFDIYMLCVSIENSNYNTVGNAS